MKNPSPAIVWFRRDLRLADNPALDHAVRSHAEVIPVFVWAPDEESPWAPGGASRWWLHHALASLDADLSALGSRLLLLRGPAETVLADLVARSRATAVHWNRLYEIVARERDALTRAAGERAARITRQGGFPAIDNCLPGSDPAYIGMLDNSKYRFRKF